VFSCLNWTYIRLCILILITCYNFTDFFPFSFSGFPHISFCYSIIFEDFNFAFFSTWKLALNFCFEFFECWQIWTLGLCAFLAFFIVLSKVRTLISSWVISSKSTNRLILTSYYQIALFIMSNTPDCSWHLYCLFTHTRIPHLNCTVIACWYYLTSIKCIYRKNKAWVSFIVH